MKIRFTSILSTLSLVLVMTLAVADDHGGYAAKAQKNLIETAQAAGQFNTLLAAIEAAGLTGALSGEGPFTVFAPTDEAFSAIDSDQLAALLDDTETLTAILTYHVVSGKVSSAEVVKLNYASTLQGSSVDISASNGRVTVDGANVVAVDIEASNGIIHVIDAVITP
jgi:uncharacterized surface protein with fasciclin (FAS1) repeats